MDNKEIRKSVSYKILVKNNKTYFNIGTIIIKTYSGDIFYIPSVKFLDTPKTPKKEIEHISWHLNGRVHIKYKGEVDRYNIIQKNGERQKISEIGFQEMILDLIKDYHLLPLHNKKVVPLDVVFDIGDYNGSIGFYFSIVSGKLIVAKSMGRKVPIRLRNSIDKDLNIDSTIRALGHHSGHPDVILQYSLRKSTASDLKTNRQIYIPFDMKISKLNIKF